MQSILMSSSVFDERKLIPLSQLVLVKEPALHLPSLARVSDPPQTVLLTSTSTLVHVPRTLLRESSGIRVTVGYAGV